MILLIDNYDSFVHNLARYFQRLGQPTRVVRNDAIDMDELRENLPTAIVISPGPCTPAQAGCSEEVVKRLHARVPILGVCLGHQAIVTALGGRLMRASQPMHGRTSSIVHNRDGIFTNVPSPLSVCRYHSLILDENSLPGELEITARCEDGTPMAIAHRELALIGVQFHPESILTEQGYQLLANFLRIADLKSREPPPSIQDELISPAKRSEKTHDTPVTF